MPIGFIVGLCVILPNFVVFTKSLQRKKMKLKKRRLANISDFKKIEFSSAYVYSEPLCYPAKMRCDSLITVQCAETAIFVC